MPIIDVVKWDAPPKVFAFRYPNCELNTKSQLIVQQSQEAVLAKEGKFYGPFGPGRHTLDTKNFPFLTSLVTKFVTGGVSPYTAEVWFVNRAIPLDIKWGTATSIQLEDPKYHIMLPVRAFGQYGVQIDDGMRFLDKLVGRLPAFTEKTLTEYFRGFMLTRVKDCIAKYLVDKDFSILQIASRLSEISEAIETMFAQDIAAYGVRLASFRVNSITTDERDTAVQKLKDALAKKAEMSILGYTYQEERSFNVMDHAASNEGNGAAGTMIGAGVGMGVGMGMGSRMGNAAAGIGGVLFGQGTQPAAFGAFGGIAPAPGAYPGAAGPTCPKCGSACPAGVKFCPSCGNPLQAPQAAAPQVTCPSCGASVSGSGKFCPECGASLKRKCANCGEELPGNVKFCPSCGTKA